MNFFSKLSDYIIGGLVRKYAGAKNSPTINVRSINHGISTSNSEIEESWEELSNRTLSLVRDFPIFSGAVNAMESFVTGDGIRPQVLFKDNSGNVDTALSQYVEYEFSKWAEDHNICDTSGHSNFYEMQALADRMEMEFGEYIFIENISRKRGYTINPTEPLALSSSYYGKYKSTGKGNIVWRGIEYNPKDKRVVAYHFRHPSDANNVYPEDDVRIDKSNVIHDFKVLRAGQMRGVTPFASAILSAYNLRDYLGSELSAQNMSAKWMAWVTAPLGNTHTDLNNRDNIDYDSTFGRYGKALDYATIEYLKQGEQVTLNTQQRQANSFKNFNEIILRYISTSIGMPYELISQDYSGLNFTTLRAVRNDFKQILKPKWKRKITHFCNPVFRKWLKTNILMGKIRIDDYFSRPQKYDTVKWITPVLEQIDPQKEFNAELMKMRSGIKSPQAVIKGLGDDPDKVLEEFAMWQFMTSEKNLVFPEMSSKDPLISNFDYFKEEIDENEENEENDVEN